MVAIVVLAGFLLLPGRRAFGYPVPPLPEDNLIVNPWFRSANNPSMPGLDGWTNVLQNGVGWGVSQKESNPSPDIVIAGACGFKEVYCGTSARWANERRQNQVTSYPGLDVYLFQVMETDPSHRKLKFFMYWVNHRIEVAEVKIYGSVSPQGEWIEVWTPLSVSQDTNPPPQFSPGRGGIPWFDTGFLETVVTEGYPYYKLEIHARYPDPQTQQGDVGIKVTGVYFATEFTDASPDAQPPMVNTIPTVSGAPDPSAGQPADPDERTRDDDASPQPTQERVRPTRTPSPTPQPTNGPTSAPPPTSTRLPPSPSPIAASPTPPAEISGQEAPLETVAQIGIGFAIGFATVGLIILAFWIIRRRAA